MQKFYDFLDKEADKIKKYITGKESARQAEREFISNFKYFREKNVCYFNEITDEPIYQGNLEVFRHAFNLLDEEKQKYIYKHSFLQEFINDIDEFKQESKKNFKLKKAVETEFNKNYKPLTEIEVNTALYNLLYCAIPENIATSTLNLLKWIKQTKINLMLNEKLDSNRFLLQFSSRDSNDDTSKGGCGKSYILEGIRSGLSKHIEDYIKYGQGMFPTNNFIDTIYSKNLFIIDEEMTSLKNINFPALKSLLTSKYYRAEEKGKMGIQLRNLANYIGASNQNYKGAFDQALADRIYEIKCDARLNLRNEDILEEVSKFLPSKENIGDSFMFLLNLDMNYLGELIQKYKEKYKKEKESPNYNKSNLFMVFNILNYLKTFDNRINLGKIKPREIKEWIKEKTNKDYKITTIYNTLIYMRDKLSFEISGDTNPSRGWNFKKLDIEKAEESLNIETDSSECIFSNRIFFGLDEKEINLEEI